MAANDADCEKGDGWDRRITYSANGRPRCHLPARAGGEADPNDATSAAPLALLLSFQFCLCWTASEETSVAESSCSLGALNGIQMMWELSVR